jgi:hypothetical protein
VELLPGQWREPFLARRRKIGWDLYGLLGIRKGDFEGTERQRRRNFEFFGAPVGLIFTLDEDLEIGSWLDLGYLHRRLRHCGARPGASTRVLKPHSADMHAVIRHELGIPQNEIVICGMAVGHADPDAVENRLVTERAKPSEFATFEGF